MSSGHFHRYVLPYKDQSGYVSSSAQATQILDKARSLIKGGSSGVMITYSANYEQTETINAVYAKGGWNTHTSGANQAAAIASMESLLGTTYSDLQGKMRIAPLTTMTYVRISDVDTTGFGDQTHRAVLERDLAHLKHQMKAGWHVLGWINQDTDPKFAVGGGVANGPDPDHPGQIRFPADLQALAQTTLRGFESEFA